MFAHRCSMLHNSAPIDAVITWVDGNAPAHKAKMAPYLQQHFGTERDEEAPQDRAGSTRFASCGELYFCIASILQFAPFVRKIFVVTDRQDPHLAEFMQCYFPHGTTPVELIDHTVIFSGYERYLPVFNSIAIESMLHRIPGLSEQFVYFNDDVFLTRPIRPQEWFTGGQSVAYGKFMPSVVIRLLRGVKHLVGNQTFGFKDTMLNAADLLGRPSCFMQHHTPHPLLRSVCASIYTEHPRWLIRNIEHRFRDPRQFSPQSIYYLTALHTGAAQRCGNTNYLLMKPGGRGTAYVQRKFDRLKTDDRLHCLCINSLDQASEQEQAAVLHALRTLYRLPDQFPALP